MNTYHHTEWTLALAEAAADAVTHRRFRVAAQLQMLSEWMNRHEMQLESIGRVTTEEPPPGTLDNPAPQTDV